MNTFKIAVLQMRSAGRDYDRNKEIILEKIQEATEQNADILLIPECFVTSYELPIENHEALPDQNPYLDEICTKAKELQIGVVVTALTQGKERPQNSAFVVGKDGTVLMKYSKVHTCDFSDEACLQSGDEFKVCDFDGVKLGVMICYDREYPESARVLMMKGAEIILVPNDCGAMRPRVQALSTRAYENMTGVVMANPNGENAGCSCAFSPICWDKDGYCVDNTLMMADEMTEGIFYAEYDLDKLRYYREHEMMGNTYRKVKAYQELLNQERKEPFIRS